MLTEWRVFLGENVETGGFEGHVVCGDDVLVAAEVEAVVEFSVEIAECGVRFRDSFQHHFSVGCFVFDEKDFSEPSFADDLEYIEFVR